jgi:hypothetical protein
MERAPHEYAGNTRVGERVADFYGRGLFKGGIYDIATAAQASTKTGTYGEFTRAVT